MKIASIHQVLLFFLLCLNSSYRTCAMEAEYGYERVCALQVSCALTLATNTDTIAVGAAMGPVKLYDIKGALKESIAQCGDGGITFTGDNNIAQVSRKGEVFTKSLVCPTSKKSFNINSPTYSLAQNQNKLFFGSDNNNVHEWSREGAHLQTYTGSQAGIINAVKVTSRAVVSASSNGNVTSIDRETGTNLWVHYGFYPAYALAQDSSLCYAGNKNGKLLIADPATSVHDSVNLKKSIFALALLKSGYLITGNKGGIRLYDMRLFGRPLVRYRLENKKSRIIALEATEKGFVSLTDDGLVNIWQEVQ